MATAEEQQAFLDAIVPSCTKYAKENNVPMVSFLIAQCCLESGWGTSGPARNLHNILGIGPGKNFDSWDSCIKAYFTSTVLGQMPELRQATTFDQYWNLFVESGYCPENQAEYKSSVKSIIDSKNLTQYDNGQVVQGSGAISGTTSSGSNTSSSGDAQSGMIAGLTFDTSVRERETAKVEEGSNPELKTFYRINMTGAQFIKQVLAPYCKSKKTGQGAYRLWFEDETSPDGAAGVKLYFKPDQYNQIEDKMSENILPDIDRTYQFTYGSGPQSSVIDFSPNYAGIVTSVTGGYEVEATTTDAITNDLMSLKYNRFTDANRPSTGDSTFDDLQGTFRVGDSSYSYDEIATRAANLWYNMAPYGYTADMTVLGDPLIENQKLCSVAVYTPQGLPHYSSGVYLIYHVSDSISGGTFTTTMNLVRNAISIGTNDSGGIDITVGSVDTVYVGEAANLAGGVAPSTGANSATSGTVDNSTMGPEPTTEAGAKIASAAMTEPWPGAANKCATWVHNAIYSALKDTGWQNTWGHPANAIYNAWCKSSDRSQLQPGMVIGVEKCGGTMGQIYGHVGIYIGNNRVRHSMSTSVEECTVDEWIQRFGGYSEPRWGWPEQSW